MRGRSLPRRCRSTPGFALCALGVAGLAACDGSETQISVLTGAGGGATSNGGAGATGGDFGSGGSGAGQVEQLAELWYSVDQLLVLVELNILDGTVLSFQSSAITETMPLGQNAITMLEDGSLFGSRLGQADDQTYFYHVAEPPRDGSDVAPQLLGTMPGGIMIEGLYTDCDGRVYGMDTGLDDVSSTGNRLLRFTGDVTGGDFTFVVVSDLATADVADIDDMSPGITDNQIGDNPGLAIDTGSIHAFDYETGSGTLVATAGTYGMHALGGVLFADTISRLYVLSSIGELFAVDPGTFMVSSPLGTGPTPVAGLTGWSGLAGPLTDCETGFTPR